MRPELTEMDQREQLEQHIRDIDFYLAEMSRPDPKVGRSDFVQEKRGSGLGSESGALKQFQARISDIRKQQRSPV